MIRWQYRSLHLSDDFARELDALGEDGWELAAIHGATAWLKRDRAAYSLHQQAAAHAAERGTR